jgi:predicted esterase
VRVTEGRDQLLALMRAARPGQTLSIDVDRRLPLPEPLKLVLAEVTDAVPGEKDLRPEWASAKGARGRLGAWRGMQLEKGFVKRKLGAPWWRTYHVYVPEDYDPSTTHAVLIWLHPTGKNGDKDAEDFVSTWTSYADESRIVILCPANLAGRRWHASDADWILRALEDEEGLYALDLRRVVAHGMEDGAELALALAFRPRSPVRGAATVGALVGEPPEKVADSGPLSFFLAVGARDPEKEAAARTRQRLAAARYPVTYREVPRMGAEYIDGKAGVSTMEELARWIDSLDRL